MKPTLTRKIIYIEDSDKETIDFYNEYFHNDGYANYMQGIDERIDLICAGDGYRECQSNFDYFCIQAEMSINEKQQDFTHTIITNQLELLEELSINGETNPMYTFNRKDELWLFVNSQYYSVEEVYPNIRPVNNLRKMYLTNMFEKDEE
jgi:hypothetical protein